MIDHLAWFTIDLCGQSAYQRVHFLIIDTMIGFDMTQKALRDNLVN